MTEGKSKDIDYSDIPETDENFWKGVFEDRLEIRKLRSTLRLKCFPDAINWIY